MLGILVICAGGVFISATGLIFVLQLPVDRKIDGIGVMLFGLTLTIVAVLVAIVTHSP